MYVFSDTASISITSPTSVAVDECGNNFVAICLDLTGPGEIENPFSVELILGDQSTATLDADFELGIVPPAGCPLSPFNTGSVPPNAPVGPNVTATSLVIEFQPGTELQACGFVTILDDDIYEDEELIVCVINSTSPYSVSAEDPMEVNITINKDIQGLDSFNCACIVYGMKY